MILFCERTFRNGKRLDDCHPAMKNGQKEETWNLIQARATQELAKWPKPNRGQEQSWHQLF
jgi:hypothetical protein